MKRMFTSAGRVEEMLGSMDLSLPRTPAELERLVEIVDERFRGSDELRRESGLGRGKKLQKKYFEEIRPLALLVRHLFADRKDVVCEPNLEDAKNYDAIIRASPTESRYVEITNAKNGHDESLRMEVLLDQGHVNLLGRVTRTGTKSTGHHIIVEDEVVRRDEILKEQLRLILERIENKATGRYTSGHELVVVFDDSVGFQTPEELAELKSSIEASTIIAKLKFRTLYLLGCSGKSFLELRLLSAG